MRPMAEAQKYAADLQYKAAQENIAAWKQFNKQVTADYQPWEQAGLDALAEIQEGIDSGRWDVDWKGFKTDIPKADLPRFAGFETDLPGDFEFETELPEWVPENFDFKKDPGYQFRLDEGLKAIRRGAAASGGRGSGATMKALQRYGQNYASGEYQNAYQRAVQNFILQRQGAELERSGELATYRTNLDTALAGRAGELAAFNANLGAADREFGYDLEGARIGRAGEVADFQIRNNLANQDFARRMGLVNMGYNAIGDRTRNVAAAMSGAAAERFRGASAVGAGAIGAENALISGQMQAVQAHRAKVNNFWNLADIGVKAFAAFAGPAGMDF